MKILIMSDSHNHDANVERAIRKEAPLDALIHLGDSQGSEEYIRELAGCPVYMVAGNCDYFTNLPYDRVIQLGKYRIMLTHGHHFFVTVGPQDLLEEAKAQGCSIVMYGHTHRPLMDGTNQEVLVLNPGSISFPRQEGKKPSYMVMEIDDQEEAHFRLSYL
ncbi:MAG: metallophosphoesterase [Lachnospiraceae bacterium]|nr:metallophosphoesterase [Lachnospiraceae bacterium]